VLHLGVASNFSCAVRASGRVFCWGANEAGQLGTGDFATSLVPVEVTGLPDAVEVETGSTPFGGWTGSACAVRRGGEAVCWGRNDLGQLGDGTTSIRPSPVSVGTLDAALRVDVAYGSVCAVRGPSPRIVCWGDAASGVTAAPTAPAALPLTTCVDVAVGGAHACAVSMDGALYCWGQNMAGQLGDGTQADRMSALVVAGISDVIDVAAGIAHTCAVTSGGTVSCWGRADLSGTGNTTMDPITTPQTVNALSDVTAVESGDFSGTTCAIHGAPRSVSCWGFDLVVGGGAVQLTPVQVTGLENVVEVGMGTSHACAIVDGGGVVCWGNNTMGRLGDGTTDSRDTPTPALGFP
jgi:alpha-tubulin suppressor-like RCC1 family protein